MMNPPGVPPMENGVTHGEFRVDAQHEDSMAPNCQAARVLPGFQTILPITFSLDFWKDSNSSPLVMTNVV